MKCNNCPFRVWFGDYALDYCTITNKAVERDGECDCADQHGERIKEVMQKIQGSCKK